MRNMLNWYTGLICVFLGLPVLVVIPVSFTAGATMRLPPPGFSLRWYRELSDHPEFAKAFLFSLGIAVAATAVSLVLGSLAVWVLRRHPARAGSLLEALLFSPLILPRIAYAVAMIFFLQAIGMPRTVTGFLIGHVMITMPYVVKMVGTSLASVPARTEEQAQLLGATMLQTFWHVTLPVIRPGVIAAAIFSAIVSFDEFTLSLFLAGPGMRPLPVEMAHFIEFQVDPTIAALSAGLVVLSGIAVYAIERTVGFERLWRNI